MVLYVASLRPNTQHVVWYRQQSNTCYMHSLSLFLRELAPQLPNLLPRHQLYVTSWRAAVNSKLIKTNWEPQTDLIIVRFEKKGWNFSLQHRTDCDVWPSQVSWVLLKIVWRNSDSNQVLLCSPGREFIETSIRIKTLWRLNSIFEKNTNNVQPRNAEEQNHFVNAISS